MDAVRQVRTMKALKSRSEDKLNELAAKDEQIQQLQQQLAVRYYTICMKRGGAECFQIRNSAFSSVKARVFP